MEDIRLSDLREKVEDAARNITYGYRAIYVLVAVGLIVAGLCGKIPFWGTTIICLLIAVALDLFEYVANIISWYLIYRQYKSSGKKDDDYVESPDQNNTFYWICWTLKVVSTIAVIITLGYNLFVTFWV